MKKMIGYVLRKLQLIFQMMINQSIYRVKKKILDEKDYLQRLSENERKPKIFLGKFITCDFEITNQRYIIAYIRSPK